MTRKHRGLRAEKRASNAFPKPAATADTPMRKKSERRAPHVPPCPNGKLSKRANRAMQHVMPAYVKARSSAAADVAAAAS